VKQPALGARAAGPKTIRFTQEPAPAGLPSEPIRQRAIRTPGRTLIEGRPRDSQGVLAELSDDSDAVAWVAHCQNQRVLVGQHAPLDLDSIGVPHPFRCWHQVRRELSAAMTEQNIELNPALLRVRLMIETTLAWERRDPGGFAPNAEDVEEAALRIAHKNNREAQA